MSEQVSQVDHDLEPAIREAVTDTEAHDTAVHRHKEPTDAQYGIVAVVLMVLTAIEVSTYYIDFGPIFLPLLLVLMMIKFIIVVLFFMHLRFDAKIFSRLFWTGFILAIGVYVTALATFQFFEFQ